MMGGSVIGRVLTGGGYIGLAGCVTKNTHSRSDSDSILCTSVLICFISVAILVCARVLMLWFVEIAICVASSVYCCCICVVEPKQSYWLAYSCE